MMINVAFHEGLIRFPIEDRGVPERTWAAWNLARELAEKIRAGRAIGVHCRQGIGRSSLIAAAVLVQFGMRAGEAFDKIQQGRGRTVPETDAQREWVQRGSP